VLRQRPPPGGTLSTLALLEAPLQRAVSQGEFHAYRAAVDRLAVLEVLAPSPPPSLREAFRLAEKAVVRVVTDDGGWAAARTAADGIHGGRPTAAVTSDPLQPEATAESLGRLTSREREVLSMLAEGSANRQIAETLGISSKTVMHHTVAIYRKLGVKGRTEAAAWAIRAGLTATG
jgi:DNA-binding NarL/FixJ family response regulator